jgi:hypothetical protein
MSSAADQLEAFPFVRELTPLDFLNLPRGLFEALPKPCTQTVDVRLQHASYTLSTGNMKRSAASAGPIWPPVLTNVLLNGMFRFPISLGCVSKTLQAFLFFITNHIWSVNPVWTSIITGQPVSHLRAHGLNYRTGQALRVHIPTNSRLGHRCPRTEYH